MLLLFCLVLTPMNAPMPAHASTTASAFLPSGITYTSQGKIFTVNLDNAKKEDQGNAPHVGSVLGIQDQQFWIEYDDIYDQYQFRIMWANYDGSSTTAILTGQTFYAQFPDYNESPGTLSISRDKKTLFFDACISLQFGINCTVFSLDIASKQLSNLGYDTGRNTRKISPDGQRALGHTKDSNPDPNGSGPSSVSYTHLS